MANTNQSNTTKFKIAETFNVEAPPELLVEAFATDNTDPAIPKLDKDYIFRKEELRDVLAYLSHPDGDGMYITGPTGSGKTSLICQVAARLNWPVQQVNAHGRLELSDLIGYLSLINGNMVFVEGALTKAVRNGHILIINEMDLAEPSELAGLNDLLEGAPLMLSQKDGEIIYPHPKFRFIATGNSAGSGDTSGLYQGVMQQNLAFMDRFRMLEVNYPDPNIEIDILAKIAPELPELFRSNMVKIANDIRRLFIGSHNASAELSITLSTRTLIRWAKLTIAFKGAPNALEYALTRSLTARAVPEQREAIHRIAADTFGEVWTNSPS
ncbi:AAA family ATPase [Thorsellia anophelis]|uniref:Cobaltochelatase CobS n=1 Tax=Thorsellia anophelis DSM 18579 TaxID=1123402 RepID=A0A1I0CVY7_9GAMM|nr:AAA family ATPase [Thorsellia anophelis]SET23808.1 cobaltochelatase CobS [Thorsellia anophelis DSM 18579]